MHCISPFNKVLPSSYDKTRLYDIFTDLKEVQKKKKIRKDVLIVDDPFVLERKSF